MDVAILVDWSTYFTEAYWQYILEYLRKYADGVYSTAEGLAGGVRVALIGYSNTARVVFNFNSGTSAANVKRQIDTLGRQAGYRRPDQALKLARRDLFVSAGGARPGVRKVSCFKNISI